MYKCTHVRGERCRFCCLHFSAVSHVADVCASVYIVSILVFEVGSDKAHLDG